MRLRHYAIHTEGGGCGWIKQGASMTPFAGGQQKIPSTPPSAQAAQDQRQKNSLRKVSKSLPIQLKLSRKRTNVTGAAQPRLFPDSAHCFFRMRSRITLSITPWRTASSISIFSRAPFLSLKKCSCPSVTSMAPL